MKNTIIVILSFFFFCLLWGCKPNEPREGVKVYYNGFSIPDAYKSGWEKYDHLFKSDKNYVNEFELTIRDTNDYSGLPSVLETNSKMIINNDLEVYFYPLNQDTSKQYQYVHKYNCVKEPKQYRYADVAYPNPCLGEDVKAKGRVVLINKSKDSKIIYCRLFYQNNSYGFSTGKDANFDTRQFMQNFYGGSNVKAVEIEANQEKEITLEYVIGKDPKNEEWTTKKFYGPARPGAYEFMLWATEDSQDPLIQKGLDYRKINPFAYFQEKLINGDSTVLENIAHTHGSHFKFISLQETFNGDNIYTPGDIYLLSDRDEKPLCDTCTGYFADVIADEWTADDYFKGFISTAPFVKADYGNRKENIRIDQNGFYFKNPGSTSKKKQKTWGEIKFGPSFLYGTVKVVAKFAHLRNEKTHTPTGIIHNLWLFQYNHPYADPIPGHPYSYLVNGNGKQPFEIDIEIWSKIYEENWGGGSAINYSIVDYMRDENVIVKPGKAEVIEGLSVDRFNHVQLNYPGQKLLRRDFFEEYHLYEIVWSPYDIYYKIDGEVVAKIDWRMATIPDQYAFLWIGSPIYQDGTYYAQNRIPFLPNDRFSHVRYISIE